MILQRDRITKGGQMIKEVAKLDVVNNAPLSKEQVINNIKSNIEKAFKEYKRKINELDSIDNLLYGKELEDDFYRQIILENNLKITDRCSFGFLAEVKYTYDDIEIIKISFYMQK